MILLLIICVLSCKEDSNLKRKEKIIYTLNENIQDSIHNTIEGISKNIFKTTNLNKNIIFFTKINYDKGDYHIHLKYCKKDSESYLTFKRTLYNTNRFLQINEYLLPIIISGDIDLTGINKRYYLSMYGSKIFIINQFGDLSEVVIGN